MENRVTTKRLYRSREHKTIAGVAAGLAQYFQVDLTLVRLALVAGLFIPPLGGITFLAYIVMAIVVPERPLGDAEPSLSATPIDVSRSRELAGLALLCVGLVVLAGNLGFQYMFAWFNWNLVWPVILIVCGGALLLRHRG